MIEQLVDGGDDYGGCLRCSPAVFGVGMVKVVC
jgi:hypothetical protein